MDFIGEVIAKYWIEFACAIAGAGLTALFLRIRKIFQKGKAAEADERKGEIINAVKAAIKSENKKLTTKVTAEISAMQTSLDDLRDEFIILQNGVLSTQGREFKDDCRRLLEESHHITLSEFEHLQKEHNVYNSLGGTSDGDDLFRLVKKKLEGPRVTMKGTGLSYLHALNAYRNNCK